MFAKPPRLVNLPQPGLQMMWALLDAAIEIVPAEHTRSFPESPLAVETRNKHIPHLREMEKSSSKGAFKRGNIC